MKMINKDALVAEIERRVTEGEKVAKKVPSFTIMGLIQAYKNTLSFLNTFEMKEVDLDGEIKEEYLKRRCCGGRDNMLVILSEPQFNKIAKHFFELGLKVQKGENAHDSR